MSSARDDDFLYEEWAPGGIDDDDDAWDEDARDPADDLIGCPACGEAIYADSPRCPACGTYVLDDAATVSLWKGRSWWWILLGGLGIAAVIYAIAHPW